MNSVNNYLIPSLPNELIQIICKKFDDESLNIMAIVSKALYNVVKDQRHVFYTRHELEVRQTYDNIIDLCGNIDNYNKLPVYDNENSLNSTIWNIDRDSMYPIYNNSVKHHLYRYISNEYPRDKDYLLYFKDLIWCTHINNGKYTYKFDLSKIENVNQLKISSCFKNLLNLYILGKL